MGSKNRQHEQCARYRSGNEKESGVRKIPGRARYGNIILKRGVTGGLDLYEWWNETRNGEPG